jgi:hypothetical protein
MAVVRSWTMVPTKSDFKLHTSNPMVWKLITVLSVLTAGLQL